MLLSRDEAYRNYIAIVRPLATYVKPNGMNMSLSVYSQCQPASSFVLLLTPSLQFLLS